MCKKWTENENELIKLHYPDNLTESIVKYFDGRTVTQIMGHANIIGVKKSEKFFKSPASGRISKLNDIGFSTRFEKQCAGWNKGKKQSDYMSAEMIAKTAKTRFKKGQDPHNTVPIGSERIGKDGYVEVKVRHTKGEGSNNNNFEFKHRVIYEQNYGTIPKGMIVEFLDGNIRNFDPSNLVLLTRKENLLRNMMCDASIVKRFMKIKDPELVKEIIENHPEMIETKRKILTINKKINGRNRKINGTAD